MQDIHFRAEQCVHDKSLHKLFIGRIFQYGYTGTISTSWRSQNEGGDKLAHAVATQLLIWETVIGERDENFNKVSTGGKDAVLDQISPTAHIPSIRYPVGKAES